MTNDPFIVEIVRFAPTDQCLTDPSLFQEVRGIVECWKEKGMKGQYWGRAVEKPHNIYWILLWESRAHAAAFAADHMYAEFVQRRQSLATAPVRDIHVALSGNSDAPHLCFEAPATEITIYTVLDTHMIEEIHESSIRTVRDIRSLQPAGFSGNVTGVADEDPTVGVYLGGWKSIEDHLRVGMDKAQEKLKDEVEENMQYLSDLIMTHVAFEKHSA